MFPIQKQNPHVNRQSSFFVVAVFGGSVFYLEIGYFGRLQLQLELVCDQGNKLRIRGFSLGIADRIPKEALQGIQIPSVPGYFDGMSDGTLHPAWGGLERFRHLGIQYLGDGIDHIHVFHSQNDGLPEILIAFDMRRYTDLMDDGCDHGFNTGLTAVSTAGQG